jgi:hypothetical protein
VQNRTWKGIDMEEPRCEAATEPSGGGGVPPMGHAKGDAEMGAEFLLLKGTAALLIS